MAAPVSSFIDPDGSLVVSQVHFRYALWLIKWQSCPTIHLFSVIIVLGGNATFPNILNNFVHVLMYFYYMLSAMGPQYQKYLWWKKYMTELQIVSDSDLLIR